MCLPTRNHEDSRHGEDGNDETTSNNNNVSLESSAPYRHQEPRRVVSPVEPQGREEDEHDDECDESNNSPCCDSHASIILLPRRSKQDGVAFADASQIHQVRVITTALSTLTDKYGGVKQDLWYQRKDIQGFRRDAQDISQRLLSAPLPLTARKENAKNDDDQSSSLQSSSLEGRGLEVRMSMHRQDRKLRSGRRILEAQSEDATPEEMAQIASALSVWPQKIAVAQAHQDYVEAYGPTEEEDGVNNKNNKHPEEEDDDWEEDDHRLFSSKKRPLHSSTSSGFSLTSSIWSSMNNSVPSATSWAMPLARRPTMLDCGRELVNKRSLPGSEPTGRRVRIRMY